VDPGFVGQITLEVSNEGNKPITIEAGDRICQIVFEKLQSPSERPYGHEDRNSKYQEQSGPVESRIEEETTDDD
jgi:dCTP deaminase